MDEKKLKNLCRLIRYDILTSTSEAGSGHPTSSLSAVELMASLFFGGPPAGGFFKSDLRHARSVLNDRFILSKGHASPLLYSLYHAAGAIKYDELMTLRKFGSRLQGHPNPVFTYVDVATGSLGQGLSVGIGMALGIRLKINPPTDGQRSNIKRTPKVWVLMGDSEMAEGQVWEALEIASYYKLSNLVGMIDVNRLGQQGETEEGWDVYDYKKKIEAFGWKTIIVNNGHNLKEIDKAFQEVENKRTVKDQRPTMIIARTIKGKGVSFLEDKENWHGKTLDENQLKSTLKELGKFDLKVRGKIAKPNFQFEILNLKSNQKSKIQNVLNKLENYSKKLIINHLSRITDIATREAYGEALVSLGEENPNVVVLDAEVANSTYESKFQARFPDRFFEMFIAEENMMSVALGLSKMGYIPFVSTFAAFLTQTFDQIRMAQYSLTPCVISSPSISLRTSSVRDLVPIKSGRNASLDFSVASLPRNDYMGGIKIVGSHAGVSLGADGPSQMGLEDIAMMRSILDSVIFYPSDSVSTKKLTKIMAENEGIFYMRTTRGKTPIIYDEKEEFEIGGFKVHKVKRSLKSIKSKTLIIAAGITLHEALKAQKELAKENIETTVVDLYCVKPINQVTLNQLTKNYSNIIVVEDHYPAGGIGEAVLTALNTTIDDRKWKVGVEDRKSKIEKNRSSIINPQPLSSTINRLSSINFVHLCVRKIPCSGSSEELLRFEKIDARAIIEAALSFKS